MFDQAKFRLIRTADVEPIVAFALQDVDGRHKAGEIGGPGRDRTDDLFHAMELANKPLIDGKGLMSRRSR